MTDRTHPDSGRIITGSDVIADLQDRLAELEAQIEALSGVQALSAVLAKWGTQPQAGAVPQGWKAVPVNPTQEMWKAAKTVPDPNPPYPPHYGLVWDAMLAASPTPPAEQQTPPGAVGRTGCTAGTDEECTRRGCATTCPALQAAPKAAPAPPSDDAVKDAARYRFLAGHCRSTSEHWGGRWSIVVDGPAPKSHDSEDDFDAAVDAALAAQGDKV